MSRTWPRSPSRDYPGERLIACHNPFLAAERARKRAELLDATEAELAKIAAATRPARRPLRGKDAIGLAVGMVISKKKVAKHLIVEITDGGIAWRRDEHKIVEKAALDGIYAVRTSLPGGGPVHSFATLLEDLATIAVNRIQPAGGPARLHRHHHDHPSPAPGLRAPRRFLPHRVRVVRQHQIIAHFRRQTPYRAPRRGNFGLAIAWPT